MPETVIVLLATAGLSVLSFTTDLPPALFLLPVMAWAAFRLDMLGAALAGAVLAFVANYMTDAGRGTFAQLDLPPAGRLAVMQAFIAVVVLVAMLIAQEAAGRVAAVRQRQAERRERLRLETLARLGQLLSGALTEKQIGDAVASQVLNDAGAQALNVGSGRCRRRDADVGHDGRLPRPGGRASSAAACAWTSTPPPAKRSAPASRW